MDMINCIAVKRTEYDHFAHQHLHSALDLVRLPGGVCVLGGNVYEISPQVSIDAGRMKCTLNNGKPKPKKKSISPAQGIRPTTMQSQLPISIFIS
jgi:hypothetical protein